MSSPQNQSFGRSGVLVNGQFINLTTTTAAYATPTGGFFYVGTQWIGAVDVLVIHLLETGSGNDALYQIIGNNDRLNPHTILTDRDLRSGLDRVETLREPWNQIVVQIKDKVAASHATVRGSFQFSAKQV